MGNSTLQKQEGYSTSNHRLMLFNTITIEKGVGLQTYPHLCTCILC